MHILFDTCFSIILLIPLLSIKELSVQKEDGYLSQILPELALHLSHQSHQHGQSIWPMCGSSSFSLWKSSSLSVKYVLEEPCFFLSSSWTANVAKWRMFFLSKNKHTLENELQRELEKVPKYANQAWVRTYPLPTSHLLNTLKQIFNNKPCGLRFNTCKFWWSVSQNINHRVCY